MQPVASFPPGVEPGQIIAEKYRVERLLGAGAMGVVVSARHLSLDQTVAIKFLSSEALDSPEATARFEREARAAVRIRSEHVAKVLDVGALLDGTPFIVMEHLEGEDLASWIRTRGPMHIEQAVEFILHVCHAMADAHSQGIVHRDLKPANLFCVRGFDGLPCVKVLDFGISKVLGPRANSLDMTRTGATMGSPLYMSPEQMRSARSVDARSDVWALGVILFELLTGRVPFFGESLPEVCVSIATQPPPHVTELRPSVPLELESAIAKCLEKDRDFRFANVGELAAAIVPFAPKRARTLAERIVHTIHGAGLSASAINLPPSEPTSSEPTRETMAPWDQTGSRQRIAGRAKTFGLGILGAAAVASAATLLLRARSQHAETGAARPIDSVALTNSSGSLDPLPLSHPAPMSTPTSSSVAAAIEIGGAASPPNSVNAMPARTVPAPGSRLPAKSPPTTRPQPVKASPKAEPDASSPTIVLPAPPAPTAAPNEFGERL